MTASDVLPEGWRWVRFGDVVRQVKDRVDPETAGIERYVAGEHMDTDDLRICRWGTVGNGYLGPAFHIRFRPGHVLYGSRRTYLRKVAVADFEGICANTTFVVERATEDLLPEFLPLVMTSDEFHAHSIGQSKGSVNPYINFKDLSWYEFALPPAPDQRTIVELFHKARECSEVHRVTRSAAVAVRESLLAELRDSSALFVPLGEIAKVFSGESWASANESTVPIDGALPVIGISALKTDGTVDNPAPTFVAGLAEKRGISLTTPLMLLVIRTNGNAARIGNVYRLSELAAGHALSAFIFGCEFENADQRDLAFEYMRSARFQVWASSLVAGSTGLKNLPIRELRSGEVPLATSASLRVLSKLKAARDLEEKVSAASSNAKATMAAIRKHVMAGRHV